MTTFFILLLLFGVSLGNKSHPIEGKLGGSVWFLLHIQADREVNSIVWSNEITKSLVAIAKPNKKLLIKNPYFQGRLDSNEPGYSLHMSDLRAEDRGTYKATVYTDSDTEHFFFKLHVADGNKSDKNEWMSQNILMVACLAIHAIFLTGRTSA
ncbi:SLAM family member 5-like [Pelodytes ibericus]